MSSPELLQIKIYNLLLNDYSYKHAFDGFVRVWREEGFPRLFSGASTATMRAVLMTVGQLSFYDQVKQFLLASGYFGDNSTTHFLSSLTAVSGITYLLLVDYLSSNLNCLFT